MQKQNLTDDRKKLFELEREHKNEETKAQAEERARQIQAVIVNDLLEVLNFNVRNVMIGRE